jgi:hypothetical protein
MIVGFDDDVCSFLHRLTRTGMHVKLFFSLCFSSFSFLFTETKRLSSAHASVYHQ